MIFDQWVEERTPAPIIITKRLTVFFSYEIISNTRIRFFPDGQGGSDAGKFPELVQNISSVERNLPEPVITVPDVSRWCDIAQKGQVWIDITVTPRKMFYSEFIKELSNLVLAVNNLNLPEHIALLSSRQEP